MSWRGLIQVTYQDRRSSVNKPEIALHRRASRRLDDDGLFVSEERDTMQVNATPSLATGTCKAIWTPARKALVCLEPQPKTCMVTSSSASLVLRADRLRSRSSPLLCVMSVLRPSPRHGPREPLGIECRIEGRCCRYLCRNRLV